MNHIALVVPGLDRIGGAERQLLLLAHGFLGRGWRVSVLALSGSGGVAAAELAAAGAAFLSLHMRKGLADPRGWLRFHHWLRREAPDVVHAHLPHAAWLARCSRLAAPVRVLSDRLHSTATGTPGRRLGYAASAWLPDCVTAVSPAAAQFHLAARMVSPSSLHVLPNGVDVELFRPDPSLRLQVRRELNLADEFLWIAAGRLEPVKDHPTLLAAMAALPASARLAVAGEGPLHAQLAQLAARLGLAQRVTFLGFQPQLHRLLQAADAFVLASRWEGLPTALLEAASCALPVLATDVPGSREAVQALSGSLVRPGDPAALAQAMLALMQAPPAERARIGRHARLQVIRNFSLESALDRWEALYAALLERNPRPRRWARAGASPAIA